MAIQTIGYEAKSRGDIWHSYDANEVKTVVNNHADNLSIHAAKINSLESAVNGMKSRVVHTSGQVEVQPNVLNVWGAVGSLTLTLAAGAAGEACEYMLEFTVSGNNFTLSLPSTVRWLEELDFEDGYTYQVSILDNLAIGAGWEAAES